MLYLTRHQTSGRRSPSLLHLWTCSHAEAPGVLRPMSAAHTQPPKGEFPGAWETIWELSLPPSPLKIFDPISESENSFRKLQEVHMYDNDQGSPFRAFMSRLPDVPPKADLTNGALDVLLSPVPHLLPSLLPWLVLRGAVLDSPRAR